MRLSTPTPHTTACLTFLLLYLLLVLDIRHRAWRDPSSVFFDPDRAFTRDYSLLREEQALSYIKSAGERDGYVNGTKAGADPEFCVGITTLNRDGKRYFQRLMGSLLAGLTAKEREDIWLEPFVVNINPDEHLAYHEDWLAAVADHVLTYKDASPEEKAQVEVFGPTDWKKKALFDYMHLMKTCYERNTPWILMLEDDTIAAEGWFYRTRLAVQELAGRSDFGKMLYLRLFYNERLLGWNGEEWLSYLLWSLSVEACVAAALFVALRYGPPITKAALTPRTCTTITLLWTPALLALYFMAGRLTSSPLPAGLNRMPKYGCCSQAFLYPRHQIPQLLGFYNQMLLDGGYVDVLTEYYGEYEGLTKWALTPSPFQHVGGTSSKDTPYLRWGRSNTETIFNFNFERFDPKVLKKQHFG